MISSFKSFTGQFVGSPNAPAVAEQIGAFCFRVREEKLEFLLVTSSRGRWILPKGWPMAGRCAAQVAAIEAWEEAGVRKGKASSDPVLTFEDVKQTKRRGTFTTRIAVHSLPVLQMAADYPEADERKRRWVTLDEAAKLVTSESLRDALRALAVHVAAQLPVTQKDFS